MGHTRAHQSARRKIATALGRLGVDPQALPADVFEALVRRSLKPELRLMLDRYLITEQLRSGPRAVVFGGWDPELNRRVAIKLVDPTRVPAAERPALARDAQRGLIRLAPQSREALVRIYDAREEPDDERGPGLRFLVMEYVQGEALQSTLRMADPLDSDEALQIAISLAESLELIHTAGVPFADLQPGTVVMRDDGSPVIVDAGLLTAPLGVDGAAPIRAPELLHAAPVDGRADQFALGAILYTLLSGAAPFDDRSEAARKAAILAGDLRPLPAAAPSDPQLWAALQRLLAPKPEDRYPSAADAARALRSLRVPVPNRSGERHPSREATLISPIKGPNQRHLVTEQVRARAPLADPQPDPDTAPTALSPLPVIPPPAIRRRGLLIVTAAAAVLGIALGVGVFMSGASHGAPRTGQAERCRAALTAPNPVAALEQLRSQRPDLACAHWELAKRYVAQDRPDEAIAALHRFLSIHPSPPEAQAGRELLNRLEAR